MTGRVLVTDAARGAAITIIRSLGAAGLEVIAADSESRSPGFVSRYAFDRLRYPSPKTDPNGMVETFLRTAAERRIDLIVPVGDEVTLLLSQERSRFERICTLALPDRDAYATTQDKLATLSLAREHDVPVPRTALVSTVAEALDAAGPLGWPLVVKPRSSSARLNDRAIEHYEVSYAEDEASLTAEVGRLEGRSEVLLQEYCRGEGQGVELLLHRGRPLAVFQHRRLHEVPITGGASSFREGVALDPTLYDYSTRLLGALDWTGLAMVEFKLTDDGPRLMEINGRVWGSLPLAVKSGVDFPARMAELYLSGPPETGFQAQTRYELGVRSRNLDLEVLWIASTLRGKQDRRLLAVPSRGEAVRAALKLAYPRDGYDVLSLDDLRPGLAEIARIPAKLRRKIPAVRGMSVLRRPALATARTRAFGGLVNGLERSARPRPGTLAVLTYHRVSHPGGTPHLYPGLIGASPAEFEEQMELLASRYRPLALEELLAVRRGEAELPVRSVLVTFDDAYRDFETEAWPILRRHGVPVLLFVPTAYPGGALSFWWDRLYGALASSTPRILESPVGQLRLDSSSNRSEAFRRLRGLVKSLPHDQGMALVDEVCDALDAPPAPSAVLDWNALRRLREQGVVIAPHSRTHPLLDQVSLESAREEIVGSYEDLVRELGSAPRVFAYPAGGESSEIANVLAEERFELAFTTQRGTNDVRDGNWLRLRRINVGRASTIPLLRAQLLPWWGRPRPRPGGSRTPYTLTPTDNASKR